MGNLSGVGWAGVGWGAGSVCVCVGAMVCAAGCESSGEVSAGKAREHVAHLAKTVESDLAEVRKGLPEGAKHLIRLYERETPPDKDLESVRGRLEYARSKVQDLRVAKSTFFALVNDRGVVVRNDNEQDLMVGKDVLGPFPSLKDALAGKYVESLGAMKEANTVEGRDDAQWVAAAPVKHDGKVRGLYMTGWSWSAYAYRLENAVRTAARPPSEDTSAKMPLIYALVVVGKKAYAAPVTPEVNIKTVVDQDPMSKIEGDGTFSKVLEITGRDFGLAVKGVPSAGPGVGVAVLRSET